MNGIDAQGYSLAEGMAAGNCQVNGPGQPCIRHSALVLKQGKWGVQVKKAISVAIGTGALLSLAACSAANTSTAHQSATPQAASTTSSVPGSAPPAAVACQDFRSATSAMAKAGGTSPKLIKAYGFALLRAAKPLNVAKTAPALVSALGIAGAANLAIADGYEPHGVAAAYNAATKYVNAAGADCKALGY